MSKKLFVGNLPFDVNDADLATVLGVAGKVESAKIVINKKTGRSKGYGFVEMVFTDGTLLRVEEVGQCGEIEWRVASMVGTRS